MRHIFSHRIPRILLLESCMLVSGICGNLLADEVLQRGVSVSMLELKSFWVALSLVILVSLSQMNLEYAGYRDRLRDAVFDDLVEELRSAMKGSGRFLDSKETKRILGLNGERENG